jgi:hypothetical protein
MIWRFQCAAQCFHLAGVGRRAAGGGARNPVPADFAKKKHHANGDKLNQAAKRH